MVCLRNVSVDTLHKGDTEDDNNNNNNNNVVIMQVSRLLTYSGFTHPEVPSNVFPNSSCLLACTIFMTLSSL
jgi:hypothetical protein